MVPFLVRAEDLGDKKSFFVEEDYDFKERGEVFAVLKKVSDKAYFFIERDWLRKLSREEKSQVTSTLNELGEEFDETIYPQLISIYGQEWSPGIDSDERITILFQRTKENVAGYFRTEDEYEKIQSPRSNVREMVYVGADYLLTSKVNSCLAHEFTHLINFNQKNRLRAVAEEIWLNELRAECAPTFLGYDDEYYGSNLQGRAKQFFSSPSDSLTEWRSLERDYGVINLFGQYLTDHYGSEILANSMKSSERGIASLNEALVENGFKEDFSKVFSNWLVAVFVNDCSLGEKYCYLNENLKNLRVNTSLILLPSSDQSSISFDYSIKEWSGNWFRVLGGEGELEIVFDGEDEVDFNLDYVLCGNGKNCRVGEVLLDKNQEGEITFGDFGEKFTSLTLIPSVQSKVSGFNGQEPTYDFSISASFEVKEEEELIEDLLAQVQELKAQIASLQAKIVAILSKGTAGASSSTGFSSFSQNLFYGIKSLKISRLQEFLCNQGAEIYPEGLVTGYFGPLTKAAVIRFQEKYRGEILEPLDLNKGTGYVGKLTRRKINSMLKE